MSPLPSGVVSRVQFTPEKVLLAGIRTQEVGFRALQTTKEIRGTLHTASDGLELRCEIDPDDASWLATGLAAEVHPENDDGRRPVPGVVRDVTEAKNGPIVVTVGIKSPEGLRVGRLASARVHVPIDSREPFRTLPSGTPQLRKDEPRAAFVCPDHPDVIRVAAGACPKDKNTLEKVPLEPNQRLAWWCPMHPDVTADRPGKSCEPCGGMELVPRVVTYRPIGQVLAVPESAVIDTGTRKVVFVESMPGMFDGVEVTLGPRADGWYPVVSGLAPGQRVAASGAFLIDAETRLNPALAAGYFGANRGTSPTPAPPAASPSKLDFSGLSASDRAIALSQKTCPVTGKPLGSMGSPIRMSVQGRVVFLCCEGCTSAMQNKPDKYLSKLPPVSKARP